MLFLPKNYFCTSSFRCKNPFFGSTQFHWLSAGHDLCLSKVSVAADYPDSVPDSSGYMSNQAYHPLEEVKVSRRIRDTKLTSAEIARTTVEVCAYKHWRTWSLPSNFLFFFHCYWWPQFWLTEGHDHLCLSIFFFFFLKV